MVETVAGSCGEQEAGITDKGLDQYKDLTAVIIGSCFEVMNELGSGFLEAVYKNALVVALQEKGLTVKREVHHDVMFRGKRVGYYITDILVEDQVIIELKCCKSILPEHKAQVINYLKATHLAVGLLVNFGNYNLEYYRMYG